MQNSRLSKYGQQAISVEPSIDKISPRHQSSLKGKLTGLENIVRDITKDIGRHRKEVMFCEINIFDLDYDTQI